MRYADWIGILGFILALISLGWQIFTWKEQRKRDDTPLLKVGFRKKQTLGANGKLKTSVRLVVENVGNCGVTIICCKINNKMIDEFPGILEPQNIIGAKLEPKNILSCNYVATNHSVQAIPLGSTVQMKYKADSGKTFDKEYTLSEESE